MIRSKFAPVEVLHFFSSVNKSLFHTEYTIDYLTKEVLHAFSLLDGININLRLSKETLVFGVR